MTPQETLQRLRDAAERISDNLLEFELDAIRRALDAATLTGETEARWREADAALQQLWVWYAALNDVLTHAASVRRSEELSALLTGASISYQTDNVPIQQRDLLGDSVTTVRCTPDELLTRMAAAFDQVKTVVAAVQTAWEMLRPRVADAGAELERATAAARDLGVREPDGLVPLRTELADLGAQLASDPLAVDGERVARAQAAVATVAGDVERLAALVGALPERLEQSRALIVQARDAGREAREAHAEATLKIVAPEVPEPPPERDALDDELEQVAALAREGDWDEARAALDSCNQRAARQLERARQIAAENRAPIERRNELRGLLDAYRGKARRLGLIEDQRLGELFEEAQATLYTAPTDLTHAGRLVVRYREALGGGQEAMR